jgi:gas vesicle protein
MYYKDEARRFNFLSGFLCGSVLGAGLAMLALPQKEVPPRRLRQIARKAPSAWHPLFRVVRVAMR